MEIPLLELEQISKNLVEHLKVKMEMIILIPRS